MRWLFFSAKVLFSFLLLFFIAKFTSILPKKKKFEETNFPLKSSRYSLKPTFEKNSTKVIEARIKKGETLIEALLAKGVPNTLTYRIANHLKSSLNLKRIKEGDGFRLVQDLQGNLIKFSFYKGALDIYEIEVKHDEWNVKKIKIPLKKRIEYLTGKVKSSIFEAIAEAGESEGLALDFTRIFNGNINFTAGVRKGDAFKIMYEKFYNGKKAMKNGKILAAEFRTNYKVLRALYFKAPDGREGYFTPEGHSLKPFLIPPLKTGRITSTFNHSRFHPILKRRRPHWGVDYAAPKGTPVRSVADGVVIFRGWDGGYGRKIGIKHSSGYISYYGHLSAFAKGIRKGTRVKQRQIIGYVGSTGLSTGPHLHFELWKNGHWLNPLKEIKSKIGRPIPKAYMPQFKLLRDRLLKKLESIPVQ